MVEPLVNLTPGLYGPGGPVTIPGESYGPTIPVYDITPVAQPPSSGGGGGSSSGGQTSTPSSGGGGGGSSGGGGLVNPKNVGTFPSAPSSGGGSSGGGSQPTQTQGSTVTPEQTTATPVLTLANK